MICSSCGCTDSDPCEDPYTGGPCFWVADDLCSACVSPDMDLVVAPLQRGARPIGYEDGFARDPESGLWLPT